MDCDFIQNAKATREATCKSQLDKIKKYIENAIEKSHCYVHVPFELQDDVEALLKRQRYEVIFLSNQKCTDDISGENKVLNITKISWKEESK